MGLFDLFRSRPKNTASVAAERLRIIVMQERAANGRPDYLPMLRRELLEVIRKYVNVDPDAIDIHVTHEGEGEVLELTVALPEKHVAPPAPATGET
ncbi:cell division topological specificity factor MinE [Dokdonella fugitiva]|jgi:cell division topological specificity factor|uniref:Cell division topological specificity factor n=1 Tax=Dokdonella fugitiva TaxID=328517 RepID=A0A4R2I454_9GAMM|nr:cell division topological specificity factor MinE [Dokdonella fugitiva]MBA8885489.1 cell division topological specificity factor [Dokdonella fugitiva]TCO38339.1 cell division topological specificity factor [Dokdonella fugitiva]